MSAVWLMGYIAALLEFADSCRGLNRTARDRRATVGPQHAAADGHQWSAAASQSSAIELAAANVGITSKLVMRVRFSSPAPQQKP
jgi:hypothetical protein